jgi:hypothetical protein
MFQRMIVYAVAQQPGPVGNKSVPLRKETSSLLFSLRDYIPTFDRLVLEKLVDSFFTEKRLLWVRELSPQITRQGRNEWKVN